MLRRASLAGIGVFTLFWASGCSHPPPVEKPSQGERSLAAPGSALATVHAFSDALQSGDRAKARQLLDESLRVYESGIVESSANEYANRHLGLDMEFMQQVHVDELEANTLDMGEFALVTRRMRMEGQFRGKNVAMTNTETMVLEQHPSGWHIKHIHWSSKADD